MIRITLPTPKACSCGKVHKVIPADAKVQCEGDDLDGVYFDCACGSTLFIPAEEMAVA